jgi:hypothetical protein
MVSAARVTGLRPNLRPCRRQPDDADADVTSTAVR